MKKYIMPSLEEIQLTAEESYLITMSANGTKLMDYDGGTGDADVHEADVKGNYFGESLFD